MCMHGSPKNDPFFLPKQGGLWYQVELYFYMRVPTTICPVQVLVCGKSFTWTLFWGKKNQHFPVPSFWAAIFTRNWPKTFWMRPLTASLVTEIVLFPNCRDVYRWTKYLAKVMHAVPMHRDIYIMVKCAQILGTIFCLSGCLFWKVGIVAVFGSR